MWGYYNGTAMSVSEIYIFETKEEAMRFVRLATNQNMKDYPDEPYMWSMLGEDDGMIFELLPPQSAEEAFAEWFGEDV